MTRRLSALVLTVLIAAALAPASPVVADKGIFIGLGLTGLKGTGLGNAWNVKTGMLGGFALTLGFSDAFALQPEIYFIQKGAVSESRGSGGILRSTMDIGILQVPLLAKLSLKLGDSYIRPYVIGGASADVKIYANISTILDDGSSYETQISDATVEGLHPVTFSWIGGAGVDFRSPEGRLTAEIRYSRTFGSITKEGAAVFATALSISLGYYF